METAQQKIERARLRRANGLAKVEPKLQGLPEVLPVNCQELPKAVLTAREIQITEKYDVMELLKLLREKKLLVQEVTRAFLRRAALAQAAVSQPGIFLARRHSTDIS